MPTNGSLRRITSRCSPCTNVRLVLNIVRSGTRLLGAHPGEAPRIDAREGRDASRAVQVRAARSRSDESLTCAERTGAPRSPSFSKSGASLYRIGRTGRGDDFLLARRAGRAVMATAWASPVAVVGVGGRQATNSDQVGATRQVQASVALLHQRVVGLRQGFASLLGAFRVLSRRLCCGDCATIGLGSPRR